MTDSQHQELAEVLHDVKGKVAVSGYKCDLIEKLYGDWKVIPGFLTKISTISQNTCNT
ncbi:hypothetical protein CAL7716_079840 [Calothrix sp. PCC 7716]|nr:hypothetical protein CAL7716_079840 [Calothrix sp. PCC 7716]